MARTAPSAGGWRQTPRSASTPRGQLHIERLAALEEPASLIELRRDVSALLPRVDLPEVILEVMTWEPGFVAAFIAASGGPDAPG